MDVGVVHPAVASQIPPRASKERLEKLFPPTAADPPANTFEIGLVLGGTVSAGAYTAGALDFLLEALEAWQRTSPPHRLIIKTAGGSSGGAVCASILGLLSSRPVPHVRTDPGTGGQPANPLWDLWVEQFQIAKLLSTSDLDRKADADAGSGAAPQAHVQHVASLVNCDMIDQASAKLARMGATPGHALPYFATPFRVAITSANLRGIPYKVLGIPLYAGYSGAAFVQHDDFAWFAFPNGAERTEPDPATGKREDEFWLSASSEAGTVGYDVLATYATASGAMPLGLAARTLTRPAEHYWYRPNVRPVTDVPEGYTVDWPEPDWDGMTVGADYSFTAVDGGTFNNDPVRLVHRALAGLVGRNPRNASDATRALFMIDPLTDEPKPIAPVGKSLVAVAEVMVNSFVSESRYQTADLELFARSDVYSRFQLIPFRPEKGRVGEAALSGSGFMALGGWCARAFRVHDFMLGRANMREYLQKEFLLSGANPIFSKWSDNMRRDHACDAAGRRVVPNLAAPNTYYLPILPLSADLASAAPVPAWPDGAFNPDELRTPLKARLQAVLNLLVADNVSGGLKPWALKILAVPQLVDLVADALIGSFRTELAKAGLLDPGSVA